jgi:hypothetical protein
MHEKDASQNPALSAILRLSKATLWVAGGKPTLLPVVTPEAPRLPGGAFSVVGRLLEPFAIFLTGWMKSLSEFAESFGAAGMPQSASARATSSGRRRFSIFDEQSRSAH